MTDRAFIMSIEGTGNNCARHVVDEQGTISRKSKLSAKNRGPVASFSCAALLFFSACGGGGKPTELILPGGIPARTDLHRASTLPAESVRTVARREYGWRLIYHPAHAPASAEQSAARALCGLERRGVGHIERIPRIAPYADPGAAIIDIYCA